MSRLLKIIAMGLHPEDACLYKGGKSAPPATPTVAPTPAVEEASVEIEDTDKKKKLRTGKSELKIPLATATDTGLKV